MNSDPLLRKLKVLLSSKRVVFSVCKWKSPKSEPRLTRRSPRRKKNSTLSERTTPVPSSLCKLAWMLRLRPVLMLPVARRRQKLLLQILKCLLESQTRTTTSNRRTTANFKLNSRNCKIKSTKMLWLTKNSVNNSALTRENTPSSTPNSKKLVLPLTPTSVQERLQKPRFWTSMTVSVPCLPKTLPSLPLEERVPTTTPLPSLSLMMLFLLKIEQERLLLMLLRCLKTSEPSKCTL